MSVEAFSPGMNEVAPTEMRHGPAVRLWGTGVSLVPRRDGFLDPLGSKHWRTLHASLQ